jgi:hypothetical protein
VKLLSGKAPGLTNKH